MAEFQVYAVSLEDRYPPTLPEHVTRTDADLLADNFHHDLERGEPLEKTLEGCIAFVFGRTEEGRSVCVRVEGVRPSLFVEQDADAATTSPPASPSVNLTTLRRELERELSPGTLQGGALKLATRRMAHFYGYEPDPASPSGRVVHTLVEVTYPSLRAWREARRLRTPPDEEEAAGGGDARAAAATSGPPPRVAHELFVHPVTRFLHDAGITPGMWVRASRARAAEARVTTCDEELVAGLGDFARQPERTLDAPYTVLYYDIETLGLDPEKAEVIQVSLVFETAGALDRHVVCVGEVAPLEGVTVHACPTEAYLLRRVRQLVVRLDPDFLVAYNGVNFDNPFLDTRARRCGVEDFHYLSRFARRPSRLCELNLSSGGMGDNVLRYFDAAGRCNLDWFVKLNRDLPSEGVYKLAHFARKFCGDDKEDMDYREIPVLQRGSPADRARLASYCVHDSVLLSRLNHARNMLVEILQFAQIFGIPPEWVYFRGQQVRFVTQLLHEARSAEAVPMLLWEPPEGFCGRGQQGYQGATVNEPEVGYYKLPVATLDWKSLYPSIMIAHNLCHSTHVLDKALVGTPGVVEHRVSDGFVAHFTTRHKGILPRILEQGLANRDKAKREMKRHFKASRDETLDPAERARHAALVKVFDGKQLALKVSCNSIYGACGAGDAGKYPDKAVSAVTTFQGREAMVIKKQILPERYPGIKIIYGDTDSVMVTFKDVTDVQECGRIADEAATFVTEEFARRGYPSMILEFEKIFMPYLIQRKKRYAGKKFEPDGNGVMMYKGIDAKGIETERTDTLPYVKDMMHAALAALMHDVDEVKALAAVDESMGELIRSQDLPFDKFVMSKRLSAKVEGKTEQIVQARVNALRRAREPGSEEKVGERVYYVILEGHPSKKTTELAEDAAYAREKKLPLNRLWYFEHAIEKPIRSLFAPIAGIDLDRIFDRYRKQLQARRLGVSNKLQRFLKPPAAKSGGVGASGGGGEKRKHSGDDDHEGADGNDAAARG